VRRPAAIDSVLEPHSGAEQTIDWKMMLFLDLVQSEYGPILVGVDRSSGAHVFCQQGWCQSESDVRGVSYAPYIHAMFGLIGQMPVRSVLMIGCGGGTLATMLARDGRHVTAVDINPAAFEVARRYFALDRTVRCCTGDGLAWLIQSDCVFDCIIIDAFDGWRIPGHLSSPAFFSLAKKHLTPSGVIMMNVLEEQERCGSADAIAANMAEAGMKVRLLEEGLASDRNVIVLGGNVQTLLKPTLRIAPEREGEQLERDLAGMRFRSFRVRTAACDTARRGPSLTQGQQAVRAICPGDK